LQCSFKGKEYKLGAARFAPENSLNLPDADIYLWENKELKAYFSIKDQPVERLKESLEYFTHQGISLFLISGDNQNKVDKASQGLPFAQKYANVLPNQKMELLQDWQKQGSVAMTGDGINDAPALAAANVAIGLGHGSDLAKQQADFILLGKNLDMLPIAHKISKITLGGIKQNLFWALAYNVVAIPVAALGFLNPMWAALFMAMSDVVVIGNSLRLRFKNV
jgi:P-type Cu+ transporter